MGLTIVLVPFILMRERRQVPLLLQTCMLLGKEKERQEENGEEKRVREVTHIPPIALVPFCFFLIMVSLDPNHIMCRSRTKASSNHYAPCMIQGKKKRSVH